VALAIVISMFQLFFELLKSYISIILSVTLAPLILMMGAVPGRKTFAGWVRGLVGNLASFPIVLLILVIFDKLTGGLSGVGSASLPATSGEFTPPFIGFGGANMMKFVTGFALLMTMKTILVEAKTQMGVKKSFLENIFAEAGRTTKQAWSGDVNLIPGISASNLAKSPLTSWMGGLGAANVMRKGAVVGAGTAGAVVGGAAGGAQGAYGFWQGAPTGMISGGTSGVSAGFKGFARIPGRLFGDKQFGSTPKKKTP
jgi:hypothetical protein